ncbi:replication protein RepA [Asaia sp. As-1742]|uniref:replication protein RepA n=1 Tax=Asaia sp. As-1742 TaxID=2608325 RepID=UPI001420FECB|nr:replication protein RepA [Asaia sp. As-1742]NIE81730.1 pirin [Asaia sp. As-1742]
MVSVHKLIVEQGIDAARALASTKHERALVEAAFQVISEERDKLGFTFSGFALTCLPHKPVKDSVWRKEGHNLTLLIQGGVNRDGGNFGVPYGSYARFILLFLQSEAIRKKSREIELGRSMRVWLGSMGLSIGGKTYKAVNEQASRISACNLTFFSGDSSKEVMRKGGFVEGSITMSDVLSDQPSLWQDRVLLNEEFYNALSERPLPLNETALRAIGPRSLVIDIYIWLSYRLHALKGDVNISWISLHTQFGTGYARLRDFRSGFIEALELATAVYPEAKLSISDLGVTLRPSKPPIAKIS